MHFWDDERVVSIAPTRRRRTRGASAGRQLTLNSEDLGLALLFGGLLPMALATLTPFAVATAQTVALLSCATVLSVAGVLLGLQRIGRPVEARQAPPTQLRGWLERRGLSPRGDARLFSSVCLGFVLVLLPLLHPAPLRLWGPWLVGLTGLAIATQQWLERRGTSSGRAVRATASAPTSGATVPPAPRAGALQPVIAIGPGWTAAPLVKMLSLAAAQGRPTGRVFSPMAPAGYLMAATTTPLPAPLAWPVIGEEQAALDRGAILLRLIWHAKLEEQSVILLEVQQAQGTTLVPFPFRLLTDAEVRALQLGEVTERELLTPRLVGSVDELLRSLPMSVPPAR